VYNHHELKEMTVLLTHHNLHACSYAFLSFIENVQEPNKLYFLNPFLLVCVFYLLNHPREAGGGEVGGGMGSGRPRPSRSRCPGLSLERSMHLRWWQKLRPSVLPVLSAALPWVPPILTPSRLGKPVFRRRGRPVVPVCRCWV
jgi:hypothetical protein